MWLFRTIVDLPAKAYELCGRLGLPASPHKATAAMTKSEREFENQTIPSFLQHPE